MKIIAACEHNSFSSNFVNTYYYIIQIQYSREIISNTTTVSQTLLLTISVTDLFGFLFSEVTSKEEATAPPSVLPPVDAAPPPASFNNTAHLLSADSTQVRHTWNTWSI